MDWESDEGIPGDKRRDEIWDSEEEEETPARPVPRRGRPRLSRSTRVYLAKEIFSGTAQIQFPREVDFDEEYSYYVKLSDKIENKKLDPAEVYSLGGDTQEQTRFMNKTLIGQRDIESLRREVWPQDFEPHRTALADSLEILAGGRIMSAEELGVRVNPVEVEATPKRAAVSALRDLAIVQKVYSCNLSQREAARQLGVSEKTVSVVAKKFREGQGVFAADLEAKLRVREDWTASVGQIVREALDVDKGGFHSLEAMVDHVLKKLPARHGQTPHSVRTIIKDKLKATRRVVKYKRHSKQTPERAAGITLAGMTLLTFMGIKRRLVIFDSSTFFIERRKQTAWVLPGVSPEGKASSAILTLHLHAALDHTGLLGVSITRGPQSRDQIIYFLGSILTSTGLYLSTKPASRYVFLDCSPMHDKTKLSILGANTYVHFIKNVPNNPEHNPIEWVFSLFKQAFKKVTMGITNLNPQHILDSICMVGQDRIKATIQHVLKLIPNTG